MYTVFLLSPASCSGKRARALLAGGGDAALAARLEKDGAPLGDVFAFISSLYFRGKLTYARRFASPPDGLGGVHVITASRGLLPPEIHVDRKALREFSEGSIDAGETSFRGPLVASAQRVADGLGDRDRVVLLGSVSTDKYLDPLSRVFGERLLFPADFVGRGDMSRGGLMLRAADAGRELEYVTAIGAVRTGPRPPKLPPRRG